MFYSICSDLYRIEDNDPRFPMSSVSVEEEYVDDDYCESDDWYGDIAGECEEYEEEYDEMSEYYAANDPSNWD